MKTFSKVACVSSILPTWVFLISTHLIHLLSFLLKTMVVKSFLFGVSFLMKRVELSAAWHAFTGKRQPVSISGPRGWQMSELLPFLWKKNLKEEDGWKKTFWRSLAKKIASFVIIGTRSALPYDKSFDCWTEQDVCHA